MGARIINMKNRDGFGIIEFIVAMGIFLIIGASGATNIISSFSSNRLADEETQASLYAQEGIEAVKSIKNQGWQSPFLDTDCSISCGVGIIGASWTWMGTENIFGKFTRTIEVSDVFRDSANNIVSSGGSKDPSTKKITSTVVWNFSPSRQNNISLSTYLTNFRKPIGGIIVYGDGTNVPKYRSYHDSPNPTFEAEQPTISSSTGLTFIVRTSPLRTEALAGFVTSAGVLQISCFNGEAWSNEWSVSVGGNGSTRRFDIAYETNSGDAVVLYSTNTPTNNEMAYRIKPQTVGCGSGSWSSATSLSSARTAGIVQWVKLAWDRRSASDLIAAIWADSNSDLSASIWNGNAWVNEPTNTTETSLDVVAVAQDVEDFDVEFESLSGDTMVVWANSAGKNGTNGVRYRTCNGGIATCTWSAVTTPPTFKDDATSLDLSANPNTDEMIFASIGLAGSDLQIGYWSGNVWTNNANVDTTAETPVAGSKIVTSGWLTNGSATRSVVVYQDLRARDITWYVCNLSSCTKQKDFNVTPDFANPQLYYSIEIDPFKKDNLVFTVSDSSNNLYSKNLMMTAAPSFTWTDADGAVSLQTTLPQGINGPFSYAFWRN